MWDQQACQEGSGLSGKALLSKKTTGEDDESGEEKEPMNEASHNICQSAKEKKSRGN